MNKKDEDIIKEIDEKLSPEIAKQVKDFLAPRFINECRKTDKVREATLMWLYIDSRSKADYYKKLIKETEKVSKDNFWLKNSVDFWKIEFKNNKYNTRAYIELLSDFYKDEKIKPPTWLLGQLYETLSYTYSMSLKKINEAMKQGLLERDKKIDSYNIKKLKIILNNLNKP